MEILATNTDYFAVVLGVIFVVAAVIATVMTVLTREWHGFIYTVTFLAFAAFLIFVVGAEVTYDALITDFDEVYEQGYEIISQKGKIVTLRKVGD